MSPRWIMFFAGSFLGLTVLNVIIEGATSITTTDLNLFTVLQDFSILWTTSGSFSSALGIPSGIISATVNVVQLVWDTLTFDYSYLTGMFFILRAFYWCFTIGFGWGCIQLIRGTG